MFVFKCRNMYVIHTINTLDIQVDHRQNCQANALLRTPHWKLGHQQEDFERCWNL